MNANVQTIEFVRAALPPVSIGVPVYNGCGPHLAAALAGIVRQDYPNLRIFISDNHSADESLAAIGAATAHDARIMVRPREVTCDANTHFKEVLALAPPSKYFMWAADDDVFHPHFVSAAVALLETDPNVVSAGSAFRLISESNQTLRVEPNLHTPGFSLERKAVEIARRFGWYSIYNLMRRDAIERAGEINADFGSDVEYLAKLLAIGDFAAVDATFFAYRMPERSLRPEEYQAKSDPSRALPARPFLTLFTRIVAALSASCADPSVWSAIETATAATIVDENPGLLDEMRVESGKLLTSASELRALLAPSRVTAHV